MRKSVYAQLVCMLLGIVFITNLVVFVTFALTTEHTIFTEMEDTIGELTANVKELHSSGLLPLDRVPALLNNGHINAALYQSFGDLQQASATQRFFIRQELLQLEHTDEIRAYPLRARRASRLPAAILKLDQSGEPYYLLIYPDVHKIMFNFRGILAKVNIASLIVGSLMFLLAAKYIVKPIRQLGEVTKKISRGEFNVTIAHKRKDEIGQLIDGFNTMAKELQGIEMLRSDFISAISHEFKTPLTSIKGYAKLLGDTHDEGERHEYASIIVAEADRLSHLASNILLLNRLEHTGEELHRENFRLDEQLRQVLLLLENLWSEKQLELELELFALTYSGNKQLLYQLWLNLLDNAIKYSPVGGKLEINLTRDNDNVQCTIRDYGPGIPAEHQRHVFDKFYKGDKSRGSIGNGLGLSIAKKVVDMHQGQITLESSLGQGTKVIVLL
ncbi:MAG: resE [Bacillota bacterium]|nr:MAG: resE [Bacillota bacterium]MBS3950518.1 HAMP domain-containing histidine kinase [Peptococcaceae bacterium]